MTDIVEKLREGADYEHDTVVMEEAADEIERLRAEIAHDRDQRLAAVVAVVRQCETTLGLPGWFKDKILAAFAKEPVND